MKMIEIPVKNAPMGNLALLSCSIGLVAAGLFLVWNGEKAVGWTGVIFFGSAIPLCIYRMLDARPKLIINDVGIIDRRIWGGAIPWQEIDSAFRKQVGSQVFLCLHLRDEDKYLGNLSPLQQKIGKLNRRFGLPLFCIGLSQLQLDATQIEGLVSRYLAARRS